MMDANVNGHDTYYRVDKPLIDNILKKYEELLINEIIAKAIKDDENILFELINYIPILINCNSRKMQLIKKYINMEPNSITRYASTYKTTYAMFNVEDGKHIYFAINSRDQIRQKIKEIKEKIPTIESIKEDNISDEGTPTQTQLVEQLVQQPAQKQEQSEIIEKLVEEKDEDNNRNVNRSEDNATDDNESEDDDISETQTPQNPPKDPISQNKQLETQQMSNTKIAIISLCISIILLAVYKFIECDNTDNNKSSNIDNNNS